jgi:hypothetical protein
VLRGRKSGFAPEFAVCAAASNDRILPGSATKNPQAALEYFLKNLNEALTIQK